MDPLSPTRSGRLVRSALVLALAGGAGALRLSSDVEVFSPDGVRLQETDAWYHARLAFAQAQHPPRPIRFDPYALHPDGQWVPYAPLPDLLVAAVAWLAAGGRPGEWTVDAVAAAFPVAFGVGCVLLAGALGRRLFGPNAGVLAAGLLAFAPGPFLERTRPGWADHHGAEACLALLALLAWSRLAAPEDRAAPRSAGLLAGLALGAYLLSWSGGALLVLALLAWLLLLRGLTRWGGWPAAVPARRVGVGAVTALAAVALFQPWPARAAVQLSALGLLLLAGLLPARPAAAAPRSPLLPVLVTAAALLTIGALALPSGLLHEVERLTGSPVVRTVAEAQPLLVDRGELSLTPLWEQHGLGLLLLPASLAWLVGRLRRRADPGQALLLVWTAAALVACLFQNRFGYYLSGAAALANAGLLSRLLEREPRRAWRGAARRLAAAAAALALIGTGVWLSRRALLIDRAPDAAWFDALAWMREHTPEPFAEPGLYAAPDRALSAGTAGGPLRGAYGVLAWWDYGDWIVKLGRRAPIANPTGRGAERAARLLLAGSAAEAAPLAAGVGYAIVDQELPLLLNPVAGLRFGKFTAIATWAGQDPEAYVRTAFYRDPEGGELKPLLLFEPRYYQTLLARLYLFGGRGFVPADSSWVVRTESRSGRRGAWLELVEAEAFPDYPSARAWSQARPGTRVVGLEPTRSCVPLEPLADYALVYESPQRGVFPGVPAVRIFERTAAGVSREVRGE